MYPKQYYGVGVVCGFTMQVISQKLKPLRVTRKSSLYLQSEQSTPHNHTRTTRTLKSCNATAAQEGQTDSYNYDTPIRTVAVHLRAAGRCMCRSSITKISAAGDSHHVQQPSIGSACTGGAKNTVGTPKAQSKGLPRMHAYYS